MKAFQIELHQSAGRAIALAGVLFCLLLLAAVPAKCSAPRDVVVAGGETATRAVSAPRLPAGLTPGDVVRAVERSHEFALTGDLDAVPRERADEVRPPFQIGLGGFDFQPAENNQSNVSVASDGVNYLVVWDDYRNGSNRDVFGARVNAEGILLDPGGIGIAVRTREQDNPCVVFDGANYLVVWEDSRGVSTDIYGARVTVDGTVLDTAGIVISGAAGSQWYPYVGFDGTNCLVVWSDYRVSGHSDIYGSRVTPEGAVLDTAGIQIAASTGYATGASLAFGGSNYLVTWRTGTNVYASRVGSDGTVLDSAGITVRNANNTLAHPSVASDGTNYLVVWRDLRNDSTDVYATRVGADGTVLDTAGIPVSMAPGLQLNPVTAFDGSDYLVVWQDVRTGSNDIYASRVSANGVVLDPAGMVVSEALAGQNLPAVVFSGVNYFVAWQDYRNVQWDIYGTRVDATVSALDTAGIAISVVGTDLYDAAIGFDGTNYLVVWVDDSDGLWDLYGARVSADGEVIDTGAFPVSTAPEIQRAPAMAFDGTDYLIVWEDTRNGSRDIYGTRVSVGGEVLDTAGIPISAVPQDQRVPSVAFDRVGYPACLVVWEDWRSNSWDIYGARVSAEGAVLDTSGIAICAVPGDQRDPAIAFGLANYYVVWEDMRNGSWDIYGTRMSREGTVQDPAGKPVSIADNYQYFPQLAFDGTNYLVAWNDDRGGSTLDIYGARVGVTGSLLDPQGIAISTAPNHQLNPVVVFDGTNHLVVWEDGRNGFPDIYGTRLSKQGIVLDADGLAVAGFPGEDFSPAAVRGPGCSALIAYSSYTQPLYRAFRIWGSIWSGPTAVLLASASAEGSGGRVTLKWELSEQVPVSSFVIERAESRNGQYATRDVRIQEVSERSYCCVDGDVESGRTYWYMIVISGAQNDERYGPLEVAVEQVPAVWALHQSYPNPFNPFCTIGYDVAHAGCVRVRVFDVAGRVVRTLVDARREPGFYAVAWDGTDEGGRKVASGAYFCSIEAGEFRAVRKMVMSR